MRRCGDKTKTWPGAQGSRGGPLTTGLRASRAEKVRMPSSPHRNPLLLWPSLEPVLDEYLQLGLLLPSAQERGTTFHASQQPEPTWGFHARPARVEMPNTSPRVQVVQFLMGTSLWEYRSLTQVLLGRGVGKVETYPRNCLALGRAHSHLAFEGLLQRPHLTALSLCLKFHL